MIPTSGMNEEQIIIGLIVLAFYELALYLIRRKKK